MSDESKTKNNKKQINLAFELKKKTSINEICKVKLKNFYTFVFAAPRRLKKIRCNLRRLVICSTAVMVSATNGVSILRTGNKTFVCLFFFSVSGIVHLRGLTFRPSISRPWQVISCFVSFKTYLNIYFSEELIH